MILLRVAKVIFLSFVLCYSALAHAEDNLYVFVFKNGVPQKGITVNVGSTHKVTNDFGLANFDLPADEYEISYHKNDELFALTDINLLDSVSSQVFLDLQKKGADVDLDLPLSEYEQNYDIQEVNKQVGPKGTLMFKVLDSESKLAIKNVKLFFKGYAVDATTDEQGIANVELSQGTYDISLIHPKYVMHVQKNVIIKADAINEVESSLLKADIVLDEFVVSAPFVEGSLASSIAELKDSDVVGDAISAEQFNKSGDSSASGALKRVTGITVVDGKFVFVRGLGERYSTVLLNGLHVPSPEPTKRVVPLDIFPSGVIQSLDIQKTYSSNLPATFGGGTVLINTKDIPKEDNYIQASIGATIHDSTGDEAIYNPDNSVPMPGIILDLSENFSPLTEEVVLGNVVLSEGITAEERLLLDQAMVSYRQYGLERKKLSPGTNFSSTIGQSFKTSSGIKYGVAANIYYKTSENETAIERDEYQFSATTGESDLTDENSFNVTTLTEQFGGLMSLGLEPGKSHKFKYTLLLLNENEDITTFGTEFDVIEDRGNERVFLQYVERDLFSNQFNGEHHFGAESGEGLFDDIELEWGYSNSVANRLEPGTFEYEYKEFNNELVLDAKKLFYLYSDLEDKVDNSRIDITLPFKLNDRKNYLKFGYFDYLKERNLDNRRFKIEYENTTDPRPIDDQLTTDVAATSVLDILDAYRPDDFYNAEQNITAVYSRVLVSPFRSLDIMAGVRSEDSTQELQVGEDADVFSLETSDLLPALAATYRFNDENQLRFGFSQSISRPDFREFSPNRYKDPETGEIVFGFPGLKYTEITNIDLKYEWFPSFDEYYTFGVFAKDFINPIEQVRNRADEDIEISFRNAESATSFGFEFGFRNNLENLHSSLRNYFVSGNYAYIDSEINLDKDSVENENDIFIPFLTSDSRPMQGQSPYVANLKIGYDNFFTQRSAILLYNVSGERITTLGINGNPDIYEQPFHKLDFVVKWGINDTHDDQEKKVGYKVTFKIENILDSELERKEGDKVTELREIGRTYKLGFSMKF